MNQKSKKFRRAGPRPSPIYKFAEADDRLRDIFINHSFGHITHEQRHQLVRFYELLMAAKPTNNMTRLVNFRDIAIKHFIDCLIIPKVAELKFPLLDIGTGAGFPGIPLKILFPQEPIGLADGVLKRIEFLKTVRASLKLDQLELFGRNIDATFSKPFAGVITRALAASRETLDLVTGCLPIGGRVYLMKGPNVDHELKTLHPYFKLLADKHYELPKTQHQRRLLIFERIN